MDVQGDMPITLVIKAPNQRMEDQTVDCMLGWTIRKLKHHLESVYPSKPKHHEQRLIYSGKLLQDDLTLKEILKQYDTEGTSHTHTVHLVCSNSSPNTTTTSKASQKAKEPTVTTSESASTNSAPQNASSVGAGGVPNSSTQSDVTNSQNDGLRHRGSSQLPNGPATYGFQSFPAQQFSPPMVNQVPPSGYPYTPEQYAWMVQQQQQAYSQYMMQYMQYYQTMYSGGQPFVGGGMVPPMNPFNMPAPTATPFPQQQQQEQPAQQQQQQPQPAAGGGNEARNNVRMNAQGGMEEDDEDERDPRDWLHHTYFIMRFITFVGIIVFYSSFSRFVMVMAGSLVIYFLQKVRVTREQHQRRQQQQEQQRREEEERQQQEQQQQQDQQQEEESGPQLPEQQPEETQEEANREEVKEETNPNPEELNPPAADQPGEEAVQEEGNKLVRSFYFILKTVELFFSSLVPAPPELVEAN